MSQSAASDPTIDCSGSIASRRAISYRMRQTSSGQSTRSPITPRSIVTPTETGRVAFRAAATATRRNNQ